MNHEGIRRRFEELKQLPDGADAVLKRRGGQRFEEVIRDLLQIEGLEPRLRLRPGGEEIDGSFKHSGRFFLLEAKWTQDTQPASSLYAFRGKIEGSFTAQWESSLLLTAILLRQWMPS